MAAGRHRQSRHLRQGDRGVGSLRQAVLGPHRRRPQYRRRLLGTRYRRHRRRAQPATTHYDESGGCDGSASTEVAPEIAHDTAATVAAARALHERIAEPNLLVKIPATPAGV